VNGRSIIVAPLNPRDQFFPPFMFERVKENARTFRLSRSIDASDATAPRRDQ